MLAFVALPMAARADGVDFTVPEEFQVEALPAGVQPAGRIYRRWSATIDGKRHSFVVTASPFKGDLGHQVDVELAVVKSRHAIDVVREEAEPLCGARSLRVSYAYPKQLRYEYRYVAVGGRLLIASYAHPVDAADSVAIVWLTTLCSGVHQPAGPVGWRIVAPYPANASAWFAPDRASSMMQMVLPSHSGDYGEPAPFRADATVTAERLGTCGDVAIRRVTATLHDGTIMEFVSGVVRGWSYSNTYSRRQGTTADPGALATLTSFCTGTAPATKACSAAKEPVTPPLWFVAVQYSIDVVPGTTTVTVDADGTLADTDAHGTTTCRAVGRAAFARLVAAMGDGSALPPCPEPRRIVPLTYRSVYLRYGDVRRSCQWIVSSGRNNDPPLVIDPRLSAIIDAVRAL